MTCVHSHSEMMAIKDLFAVALSRPQVYVIVSDRHMHLLTESYASSQVRGTASALIPRYAAPDVRQK